ncbi:protein PXR1-like [Nicotiana sylvestris]|uniref:protein PXR1-like n=1 Tax=Nicotiana sylvestris TaxID=4096 RepID=UPI00388C46F4
MKKEKESEGVQGDIRGKGKEEVVESSPTHVGLTEEIWTMVLRNEEVVDEEESWREEGGTGFGDAAGDTIQLFRVKGTTEGTAEGTGVKVPGTARALNKRKATSSIPVETPPMRGRAIRSQRKQSEAKLERALEENKRKVATKGKKKVNEQVEAIEVEEIDLDLHEEDEAEELLQRLQDMTPKAKKRKTFKKKSPSKTVDTEPSALAQRTRSARKSRKVQVVEEEDSEEERKLMKNRKR